MSHMYYYVVSWYLFLKDFGTLFLKNSFQDSILAHCLLKMAQSSYSTAFVSDNMIDILKNFSLIVRL